MSDCTIFIWMTHVVIYIYIYIRQLFVCLCMYVCMYYVCMYVCMYVCVNVCVCVHQKLTQGTVNVTKIKISFLIILRIQFTFPIYIAVHSLRIA
jgi:hypothetical protein